MTDQNSNEAKEFLWLIVIGFGALAIIYIVAILAVLLTIILTGGALYLGSYTAFKLGTNTSLWEDRRIEKHKRLCDERRRERKYFADQGQEFMVDVVDGHYDDKSRGLYDEPNRLDQATNTVRKIREAFK